MRKMHFSIFFLILFLAVSQHVFCQKKAVFLNDETSWADSLMATLSEEERIAQLFMVAAYSNKGEVHKKHIIDLVDNYKIGGLMFLQGGPVRQARLTNDYQLKSKIPLMIAIDAEWGVSMRLDSSLRFPWQMTLGAIEDVDLIYEMGVEVARQCKLLGIHINFAPVVDVNSNPENPIINNRSFGEHPYKVGRMGLAYMKGMQDNNILACAKHFPGHGDTDADSHKTLPTVHQLRYQLESVEIVPYRMLIKNGLGSVMVGHLHIPSLDDTQDLAVSLSPKVVDGLLKKDLGFTGLSITDALNMKGVSQFYAPGEVDVEALLAGNDVLLFAEDVPKAIEQIKEAIQQNKISQEEIDKRCHKILMAKQWMGLNDYKPVDLSIIQDEIIKPETKLLNKKLVKSSLTLLQNYDNLLPLKRLDTLRIAAVSIGEDSANFKHMLSNYAPIKHFSISDKASESEQAVLLNKLSEFNLVIASVHKSNANAWKSYKIIKETDILLQSIALQSKVIVTIFANPYSMNSFLFTNNFDALMLSYQNSKVAQEQTAQAIFGGIMINGKLPVNTKHYDINSGIKTESIRMRYTSAKEIGFRTDLLYKIDSIVENAIFQEAVPGCQVFIAKDGNIFLNKSYGYHTYEKKVEVKNSDVYDLASITKIAASVPVLMHMIDDKKFNIDYTLGKYLDLDTTNKKDLIIREILAHQASLIPWIPFYQNTLVKDSVSGNMNLRDTLYSKVFSAKYPYKVADGIFLHKQYPDSILFQIIESELLEEKKYCYSDLGYYLFKEIIEKEYKKPLNEVTNELFYQGLGMENLGYLPLSRIDEKRIIPTEMDFEFRSQLLKGYVHDMGAAMQGGVGGHAGLFSNANDLAKLMQMYLQNGEYGEEKYLSSKVIAEFVKCQFPENNNRRGAGFDKAALPDEEGGPASENASIYAFGHSGFTGTLAWADPESNLIYIFLSNRIHPDASNKKLLDMDVRTEIMQVIYDSLDEK
ncbi:MAG: glycoside hydrolase family 3 N-terminal domain-containing protein [Bacteroidota bacterium]|nr:glycoside hydrolase family 3 N-terminal domain-containing protein [Bacteroidota bacterium]